MPKGEKDKAAKEKPAASQSARQKSPQAAVNEPLPDDRFLNRELTWLAFNERVLAQAANDALPILERGKFLAITSSNLDEFMMVRVGGLKILHQRNPGNRDPAGMVAVEQLQAVAKKGHEIVSRQYEVFRDSVLPKMEAAGIHQVDLDREGETAFHTALNRFQDDVFPVLSPQAVTLERFPLLPGLGLNVLVRLTKDPKSRLGAANVRPDTVSEAGDDDQLTSEYALIPIGKAIPRVMSITGDSRHGYILLENLVTHFVADFFPGRHVEECFAFRLTRNADIELREDEASDLLGGMEEVLENRRYSRPVRLEYWSSASEEAVEFLRTAHQLHEEDLYPIDGPIDLSFLFALHGIEGFDHLRDEPWPAKPHPRIDPEEKMFSTIAEGDLLLVHPYERFDSVVRLIEEAAVDPDVLAIKQVLYRTSKNSPVVAALERAAERGKYVTAIVELKARFDEARNIEWAREMERAGVQVIYGIHGLKTHAKICIIVRREQTGVVRYMHFGTGNYNEVTSKLYGDISLLTSDEVLGHDATTFFNAITGASQPRAMEELAAAPTGIRKRILDLIEGETSRCLQGGRGKITAKLNALVDTQVIDALYRASRAGVEIRLNVRGQCCLRPGVKGLSETIKVVSIVDRFLEHARILKFHQGGDEKLFISSADWMPRNLDRRVELLVPVSDAACSQRLKEVLATYFQDNTNAWLMNSSGEYKLAKAGKHPELRSQRVLYEEVVEQWQKADAHRRTTFRPIRAGE
ncbi:polyphosphate kinase 1 [Rhodopirellula sp. MGV]|uniref:polyphosphate kinase 1 n=1 Tax=Rhodopirellula sp. MGV TaxID=2023130 RepID=UPI000B97B619|nr:polyphosphate kinase 1 [Rhodopirellula sp. MGV]OYP35770.1 polyphosphate kinase 1 [Rhodopirellula sp. MGV]PNY33647.1 polyphosphate kinase 1 [Rhodopirellula baltica]